MADLPIPGTVAQVDINGSMQNIRHNENRKDIILVPQPSNDPEDPLNWSPRRKLLCDCAQIVYTFFGAVLNSSQSPANLLIQEDTGITLGQLNTGTGLMFLFLGWGNVIMQPLALNYGRRPVLLVSMLSLSMFVLWSTYCRSAGEWYANRILIGLALSPIETLIEICVSDIHFAHERGFYLGIYGWCLFNGAFLGPIPAGFVADRYGWRWIQYICTILGCAAFVFLFFFLEETMYHRRNGIEAEFVAADSNTVGDVEVTSSEKTSSGPAGTTVTESPELPTPRKTWIQKLKVTGLRAPDQPNTFLRACYLPFTLVQFPAIVFAGLLLGSILSWFNVVNGTLAAILGAEPYNFSAHMLGVTYIACVVGVTIGCYFAGMMSDQMAIFMARRNRGIYEPEQRLWVAAIPAIVHPAGCLLYGVGAAHHIHWFGVVFGLAMISVTMSMGSNIAYNYIIDSYREVSGEGLVTSIIFRNTIGKSCPRRLLVPS